MEETQKSLHIIKSVVLQFLPNSRVVLFGSRAKNMHRPDSDYDIMVISNSILSFNEKMKFKSLIRKALVKKNIIADVLINSKEEVRKKQKLFGHIVRQVINEGVIL